MKSRQAGVASFVLCCTSVLLCRPRDKCSCRVNESRIKLPDLHNIELVHKTFVHCVNFRIFMPQSARSWPRNRANINSARGNSKAQRIKILTHKPPLLNELALHKISYLQFSLPLQKVSIATCSQRGFLPNLAWRRHGEGISATYTKWLFMSKCKSRWMLEPNPGNEQAGSGRKPKVSEAMDAHAQKLPWLSRKELHHLAPTATKACEFLVGAADAVGKSDFWKGFLGKSFSMHQNHQNCGKSQLGKFEAVKFLQPILSGILRFDQADLFAHLSWSGLLIDR